jgi:membrane protein
MLIQMKGIKMFFTSFWSLLRESFSSWSQRDPFYSSVVISYYTIFSLPGLLVIIINLVGAFFGTEVVTHEISVQISSTVGQNTAADIEQMVSQVNNQKGTTISTILSIATLLFGATGVFYQLQRILNQMWEVEVKPKQKILKLIKDRIFSFGLILAVGFLLLVSLVISAGLAAMSNWISDYISDSLAVLFTAVDVIVSVAIVSLLFAAIFKFLPDAQIRWRDVWPGAVVTALLFVLAKFGLSLYFGKVNPGSTYGAAGTIILIMLWVSYAALILLFGAEFTQAYANRYGARVKAKA